MFCRSLLVVLSFFFWPLCCLFFFDILILIAPLVSSNSSSHPVLVGSCSSIQVGFLCSVLLIVVCPFVSFLLVAVLCILRFKDSDYPLVYSNSYSYKSTIEIFNLQAVYSNRVTHYGTWLCFLCYDLWPVTTIKESNEIFNKRKYPDI